MGLEKIITSKNTYYTYLSVTLLQRRCVKRSHITLLQTLTTNTILQPSHGSSRTQNC